MTRVTVSDLSTVEDHGSILTFTGMLEDGSTIRFGADHRAAQGLIALVEDNGEVECAIEPWQILGGVGNGEDRP
jgi:hypothetical protein